MTDAIGDVKTEYTYEPFGGVTVTGSPDGNTLQFTGRENDSTGLYYYRARYYNPTFQRFITEDPLGFVAGDVDLYTYVGNSPPNFTDPTGLCIGPFVLSCGALIGAAITAGFIGYDVSQLVRGGRKDLTENLKNLGLDLLPGGRAVRATTAATTRAIIAIQRRLIISGHAAERMAEYGVTRAMVRAAVNRGTRYWDPENASIVYVFKGGLASGKSLAVAQDPITGTIKTVMTGKNVVRSRFQLMP